MTDLKTKNIKYEDYLNMRNFLNNEYKILSIPSRIEPIAPIIERTIQEELKDMELQRKKAFDILTKELSIKSIDAGNIVNNMLITNDPEELINFNSYYRGFKEEIRGQNNLTPDVFNVLWNRYKEKIKDLTIPSRLYGKTPEANTEEMIKEFMDIDYEADLTAEENRKKRNKQYEKDLSNIRDLKEEYYKALKKSIDEKSEENDNLARFYENELFKAFNKINNKSRFINDMKYDLIEYYNSNFKKLINNINIEDVINEIENISSEAEKDEFLKKYKSELNDINSLNEIKYNMNFEMKTIKDLSRGFEERKEEMKEEEEKASEQVRYMAEELEIYTNELNDLKAERANRLYVLKQDLITIKENLRNAQSRNDQEQINNFTIQYAAEKERLDNFDNLEAIKGIDERIKTIEDRLNPVEEKLIKQEKEDNDTIEKAIKKLNKNRQEIKALNNTLLNKNKINFDKKIMDMTIQDIKNVIYSFQNNENINIEVEAAETEILDRIKELTKENIKLSKSLTEAETDRFIKENEKRKLKILRKSKRKEEMKEEEEKANLPQKFLKSIKKRQTLEEAKIKTKEQIEEKGFTKIRAEILKEELERKQQELKNIIEEERKEEEEKNLSIENKQIELNELKNNNPEEYLNYLLNLYENNTGSAKDLYNMTYGKKRRNIFRDILPNLDTEEQIKFMEKAFLTNKKSNKTQVQINNFLRDEGLPFMKLKGGKIKSKKNKTKKNKTKKINDKYINL